MATFKRIKTKYPGVYYIMGKAIAGGKPERIYYIRYRKDGKMVEEKAGRQFQDDMTPAKAATKRASRIEGKQPSNQAKRETAKAAKEEKSNIWTINKLWDKYCETYSSNKGLKNENMKYEKYIRDELGKKEPAELMPLDIDRLRMKLQKQDKKTMAARVLELLRRTVNFGVKRGLINHLPFKIEIPKLNNQTTEDLSPDQLKILIEVLDKDEDQTAANIMRLALYSGMRKSEIFSLRWSDIDFRRGFITLQDPKGGVSQSIPMNEATTTIFTNIQQTNKSEYVFPGRFPGQHLKDCRKSFVRIKKAAKLPDDFRPLHGLRHVFASMLASSGEVDMYVLQKLLTHKSPQMTQRYAHLRDETLKKGSDVAASIITEITKKIDKEEDKKVVNLNESND